MAVLAVGAVLLAPQAALAQAAWEYSPYQVRIWIAASPRQQLPPQLREALSAQLADRAEVAMGAVWSFRIEQPPDELRDLLLTALEIPPEQLKRAASDVLAGDKLIVVRPDWEDGGWQVAARELDCRTRQWGHVARREAGSGDALGLAMWDAVSAAFTPLVRIEAVEGQQLKARLRSGGLVIDPASPAMIEPGMVLRPVLRRNDRSGQPAAKGGIQPIPWTLLAIENRTDSLLDCRLHSGFRAAIPSRTGPRMERLALLVKPQFPATTLSLRSKTADPRPLTGYEVFAKQPDGTESPLLGVTDWRGQIDLPRTDGSLQLFLIRNGSQLLARLPIVPGQDEQLEAQLVDDDGRLQAEGAVAALHSRALDLAARREILATRFRARLKVQKFDEAQALLDEFRRLDSRTDLGRALDEAQQQVQTFDRLTQQRVDKLFGEARKLLTVKALSDDMINTLQAELTRARSAPRTASTSS
jgi:hypothetical protein